MELSVYVNWAQIMTNFKQVAAGLLVTYSTLATPAPQADTVKPDLTGNKVKSTGATTRGPVAKPMATNSKQMPRLFPKAKLTEFELVAFTARDKPVRPAERDLDTILELSMASGRSPGSFWAAAESESAGSMNPLARASKSKRDANDRIIGLEPNGSASGMYMFINGEWDRVVNSYGNDMLKLVGVKDTDKDLKGNRIFKDDNFSDQQIVDIVRQHVDRDTTVGDIPRMRGSEEMMALRGNLKLMGAAKVVRDSESIKTAEALGLTPTLGTIHERHIFGGFALSQAARRGQSNVSAVTLFSTEVVGANPHLFKGTVGETISTISNMTDARASYLEKQFYGTVFHTDLAEKKRMETPREYQDAQGRPASVAPAIVIKHNTLQEYVQERKLMHTEMVAYDSAVKSAKTPQDSAAAEKLRNLDAAPRVESFLKRTGYIGTDPKTGQPTATLDEALASFRSDAGIAPGRKGFFDRVTLNHIQRADDKLTHFAGLQAQQAVPAQPEVKASRKNPGQPEIKPAPNVLDLRYLQREQASWLTPKERKAEIAAQVVALKNELVADGLIAQPTEKVKTPYVDAKGKPRFRMEDKPREFDVKRDGGIDKRLISIVATAQQDRGLKGTAVIDPVTQAELKKPAPAKLPHIMGIVPPTTAPATPARVGQAPLGPTGYQVQQLAALGRQLHPGEQSPLAGVMHEGSSSLVSITLPKLNTAFGEGPRQSFLDMARPSTGAYSAPSAYTLNEPTLSQIDLSALKPLTEPAPVTAPLRTFTASTASKNTLG